MQRARERELDMYCERHHVLPKSLGGSNAKRNLIRLTYREHFLAHWLLTKFTRGAARKKMCYALHRLSHSTQGRVISSWQYDVARRINIRALIGRKLTLEQCQAISTRNIGNQYGKGKQPMLGKRHSEATKLKISAANKGKQHALGYKHTKKTKKMLSDLHTGNKYNLGRKCSEEERAAMRERSKNPTPAMLRARTEHSLRMKGNQNLLGKRWTRNGMRGTKRVGL